VTEVSWTDAQAFLSKINAMVPGLDLALPSEAQWEYACRAGTQTAYHTGEKITRDQANFDGSRPVPPGSGRMIEDMTVRGFGEKAIAAKQLISQNKIDFLCGKCGVVDDVRG
jgi:formylglycine-generating enzyme required for sulfatase activity